MKTLLLPFLMLLSSIAGAQPLLNPFSYSLPVLDTLSSSVLPMPPAEPAGSNGRIGMKDGHFVYPDGSIARFFGTTLAFSACFPDSAVAIQVARQLHTLGFNAVRLTGYDISYWDYASILQLYNTGSSDGFDPAQLKRFDWFIYQLKMNGIYIHLPLLSARTARQGDGIVNWDSMSYGSRGVIFFESALQKEQKKFIRRLLEHINPYTTHAYREEPALAFFDLTDDNSLFTEWRYNRLQFAPGLLSYYHTRHVDTLFTSFLQNKYKNESTLKKAWIVPATSKENLITNPGYEEPFNSAWYLIQGTSVQALLEPSEADKKEGTRAMRLRIGKITGTITDLQLRNQSPRLQKNKLYEMKFWSKTTTPGGRMIRAYLINGSPPYNNYGINYVPIILGTDWKEISVRFRALDDDNAGALLIFFCGDVTGDILFDDFHFTMLDEPGLLPGESLASGSMKNILYDSVQASPEKYSYQRMKDQMEFYTGLADGYARSMYSFIKDTLHCSALVSGGNSVTLLNDVYVSRTMDFTAINDGWDYARDTKSPAAADTVWSIGNNAMVGDRYAGRVYAFAHQGITGKPRVITRYTMPNPSAHMNEMATLIPAYAAYQGLDAIYIGNYCDDRAGFPADSIREKQYSEIKNNPALMSLIAPAAAAFRHGLIAPAKETVQLHQTPEAVLNPFLLTGAYWMESYADNRIALFRKVEYDRFDAPTQSPSPNDDIFQISNDEGVNTAAMKSDTEELLWNADDTLFTVNTPHYLLATGKTAGSLMNFGDIIIERFDAGSIGTCAWISDDALPITDAPHSLITLSSRSCNTGAQWTNNNSIRKNWGHAPTQMEAMNTTFSIRSAMDSLRVYPLNARGMRTGAVILATKNNGRFSFKIDQQKYPSVWFQVEQTQSSTNVPELSASAPGLAIFPSPARNQVSIGLENMPGSHTIRMILITPLGLQQLLWEGISERKTIPVNIENMPDGMYVLHITIDNHSFTRLLPVIH